MIEDVEDFCSELNAQTFSRPKLAFLNAAKSKLAGPWARN